MSEYHKYPDEDSEASRVRHRHGSAAKLPQSTHAYQRLRISKHHRGVPTYVYWYISNTPIRSKRLNDITISSFHKQAAGVNGREHQYITSSFSHLMDLSITDTPSSRKQGSQTSDQDLRRIPAIRNREKTPVKSNVPERHYKSFSSDRRQVRG